MKIREDYVSNSSSTSFVIAVNKEYKLKDFASDVAKASVNKSYEHHDDEVEDMNYANLYFNLFHNELLFLGTYIVETSEHTYAKKDLPIQINECMAFDENEWKREVENIEKWKELKDHPDDDWEKAAYSFVAKNYVDENEVLHLLYDHFAGQIAVDMKDYFNVRRSQWFEDLVDKGEASKEQLKVYEDEKERRLQAIKGICKALVKHEMCNSEVNVKFPNTYQITMNTIKNTRDMLKAGFELKFDKWENLDDLENRLKEGQQLFCIRNNHSGDGWDNDAIYSEDDAPLLCGNDNLAMEYLHSESL